MARIATSEDLPRPAAPKQDGQDDLAILHPEQEMDIDGVHVVMREYGGIEGLRLAPHVQPLVDAIADVVAPGQELGLSMVRQAFAKHEDHVVVLMATACDRSVEWVSGLSDTDFDDLLALWYGVNAAFFVRRVVKEVMVRRSAALAFAGLTSTPPSSITGTTPGSSESTRTVN
jgi:hypothetical protein